MKARIFFAISLLSILAFSCQKEIIAPENGPTQVLSMDGNVRPSQQCGASAFTTFKNGATSYGTIEILNNAEELYILTDMTNGWFLRDVKIFAGDPMDLPKGNNGDIQKEEFPMQMVHTNRVDQFTYTFSTSGLGSCFGVTIWAHAVRLNMFGHEIGSVDLWADGTSVLDGFSFQYCNGVCSNATIQTTSTF